MQPTVSSVASEEPANPADRLISNSQQASSVMQRACQDSSVEERADAGLVAFGIGQDDERRGILVVDPPSTRVDRGRDVLLGGSILSDQPSSLGADCPEEGSEHG
jgi:hypothetical protein